MISYEPITAAPWRVGRQHWSWEGRRGRREGAGHRTIVISIRKIVAAHALYSREADT